MKDWMKGTLLGVIVVPMIAFSWGNIQAIWANPEKTEEIAKKIEKQESSLEQVSALLLEQKIRQEKHEAVTSAQLELIAEMKKKK